MTMFFFLPSPAVGFMFPFRGMPRGRRRWAIFPLTHFLRTVRSILLKGSGVAEITQNMWPLALILLVASAIALKRYQTTLD